MRRKGSIQATARRVGRKPIDISLTTELTMTVTAQDPADHEIWTTMIGAIMTIAS
jgi:hypothetical protein